MASDSGDINMSHAVELDVVVVGAGFGGVYQLKRFRDEGYKVKILEAGTGYGGVWHWNAYPGARVDTPTPLYEFDKPELWKDWSWKQRFPDHTELRAYFDYVADKWDLRKDTQFNSFVESATWDEAQSKWTVKTREGGLFRAKFLSLNTGFAAKRHVPDWKGLEGFKGLIIHPSYWPHEGLDLKGKKVALVGTGSTGVQIATNLASAVSELTVFQRSINTSMPMVQANFHGDKQNHPREEYPRLFKGRTECFTGFDFHFLGRNTFDDDPETRQKVYEDLWAHGDFHYWLATYNDMLFNDEANREAYNFWRDKTRAKINDPRVQDILAPMEQPYPFGCKRISLEQGYFEIFNEPHVNIVDVNATPIKEITEKGIKTSEKEHEIDVLITATGYDAVTGGLTQIDIRGATGQSLRDYWKDGAHTLLGITVAGFPNMFMTYAPQGPTAFCNGPVCAQVQGDWIVDAVKRVDSSGLNKITAEKKAEDEWRDTVMNIAYSTLLPKAKSWYMGDNIEGKPREPLIYLGGVDNYYKTLKKVAADDYAGFKFD
ncbi:hypothetical protein PFICI_12377 [Pestalotiopsis fici W106-1]|uniref:FAD/NAD(P)-binding domain-containing protein n=1 Tax=Pestalotiopsis fici (strain W106-1 / CGMCC3.15140) TaxID=1229662 RepID=W3WNJ9_PESFW|nr:uncharacterized protein PFICI_12377 [Pestalotiopsis fici W106-1]ETS75433.1 hypothetical protein PFICI_12377 [Pestalotiopsis fici W106-1]